MLLLMKVLMRGRFIAFNLIGRSIIGTAEISTFGSPMNEIVACLTNGGLFGEVKDQLPPNGVMADRLTRKQVPPEFA
jgi:hypothetical protein